MHRFLLLYFFLITFGFSGFVMAQNAEEDYDSLSRLSSEQLMENGRRFFEQRQAGKALSCFTIVSERYKSDNDTHQIQLSIRALNNCGCVYKFFYFDYPQAYSHFNRAYELCEESGYTDFLPIILVNLGDLLNDYSISYDSQPLREQAQEMFTQSIKMAVEQKNWELLTTAFFNLANQNFSLDLKLYDVIFGQEIPEHTPDLAFIRLQYKGIEKIQQGEYGEARQYFLEQLPVVSTRWEPERDTISTYMSIAHTYILEDNYLQATNYLEKAFQICVNNDIDDHAAGLCRQIAECYRYLGDNARQQQYHTLYLEKMEQTNNSRLSSIGELNYINELKKEEAKAIEYAQRQRLQQYALLGIGIILLVVIFPAIILWRQNRRLKELNKSLYEKYRRVMETEAREQKLRKSYDKITHNDRNGHEKSLKNTDSIDKNANESTSDNKYSHSNLSEEQKETLIFRIQELLDNPDIICKQDFSLGSLAKLANSNTTYVSQVINEKCGVAFSIMLGGYRVKEACRRINETEEYSKLTIEAIASNVGFKSRTAFINAFKREVGLTPSEYIRMATAEKVANHKAKQPAS